MAEAPNANPNNDTTASGKPVCGVVMPISAIDGCSEMHWSEVLAIVSEAIECVGFQANLVSNADDVGVIQKRIIQNLYENPIVVCDVSAKNPNVMFELGMRLAFDKPTIIIKDDKTSYSFDTASIEHLEYPRDLRFSKILDFKARLSEKVRATLEKSMRDQNYTTFLKHFGEFKVAKIERREVSGEEYILDELRAMRSQLHRLERSNSYDDDIRNTVIPESGRKKSFFVGSWDEQSFSKIMEKLTELPVSVEVGELNGDKRLTITHGKSPLLERRIRTVLSGHLSDRE